METHSRLVGTEEAWPSWVKTPDADAGKRQYTTGHPPASQNIPQKNQSSNTTTSSAVVRSSTPLLGVVASTARLSFSSRYFLPKASMTSF